MIYRATIAIFLTLSVPAWSDVFGIFTYTVRTSTEFGTYVQISKCDDTASGSVIVPETIGGNPVKVIAGYAFRDCSLITSVSLPAGIREIGSSAFYDCLNLETINIPDGISTIKTTTFWRCESLTDLSLPNSVTEIQRSAFAGCYSLTNMALPDGLTTLGNGAFAKCINLTTVSIPKGVLSLQGSTFAECWRLESVSLPSNLQSMGIGEFRACWNLRSIHIPDSVSLIGNYAFQDAGLISIKLPDSLAKIEDGVFEYCTSLTQVEFPEGITEIGTRGFAFCPQLMSVLFRGNAPAFGANVFFSSGAPGFNLYYFSDSEGFSSPFNGYPAKSLGNYTPLKVMLLFNGLPPESDPEDDLNGDGVSLLMAYALGLDPRQNLAGMLPKANINGGNLGITFYADAEGITYVVETSTDLVNWTTTGVVISELSPEGNATASVSAGIKQRFLRLNVTQ